MSEISGQKCLHNSSGRLVPSQKELKVPSNGNFFSMSSLRRFPFLTPKRVLLNIEGKSWHFRIPWEDFFSNNPCSPFRFCYILPGNQRYMQKYFLVDSFPGLPTPILTLQTTALKVHPFFFLQFNQLPPGGERYHLGLCRILRKG